jgi:hypothetical protein
MGAFPVWGLEVKFSRVILSSDTQAEAGSEESPIKRVEQYFFSTETGVVGHSEPVLDPLDEGLFFALKSV